MAGLFRKHNMETPKPMEGTWVLVAPNGREYTGLSPIQALHEEQAERVPDDRPKVPAKKIKTVGDALVAAGIIMSEHLRISDLCTILTDMSVEHGDLLVVIEDHSEGWFLKMKASQMLVKRNRLCISPGQSWDVDFRED
jgi:hypothetical protein